MQIVAQRPITRAGLRSLLQEVSLDQLSEAASLEQASTQSSDVILTELPDELTEDWLHSIETLSTNGTYLVALGEPTQRQLKSLLEAGARGVISTTASGSEVVAALQSASKGLFVLDAKLVQLMLSPQELNNEESDGFTEREKEVLELLARGWPNRMIANKLQISEHTVKFHVASLLQKLGASSRTEAVTRAVRKGFVAL